MENNGIDKVISIPCNRRTFYRAWLSFLTPIHHFTPQVINIAAELLRHREILSKKILDEELLTKCLLDHEIKEQIIKDCNITLSIFNVALSKLRKGGFFKDGKINPRLIPNIGNSKEFNLMLMFVIDE